MKLFHEAESRPSSALHFPGRKLPSKTLFPPRSGWPGRERVKEDSQVVRGEAGPSTQGSKPHPCSIYTASGKMPPGSWTCPSGRLHQSGISLGNNDLKSLFCQCFQSSSFSKGLTAFSYANQTKKRQLHSPICQWGKSRLNTYGHSSIWEALKIHLGSQT